MNLEFLTEEEKKELSKRHARADVICLRAVADIIETKMNEDENDEWDADKWADENLTSSLNELLDLVPTRGPIPTGKHIMLAMLNRALETIMFTLPEHLLIELFAQTLSFNIISEIGLKKITMEKPESNEQSDEQGDEQNES